VVFGFFRNRRRSRLIALSAPPWWEAYLAEHMPCYDKLPPEKRARLHGLMQVFLAEKNFEGCGGLDMTDEIRVIVAAHACLLELGREPRFYPRLYSVLVYPYDFIVETDMHDDDDLPIQGEEVRVGEAWQHGAVVLSYDGVLHGTAHRGDGENVLFHEFAHQLDMENGDADGYPPIADPVLRADWARVMGVEYEKLVDAVDRGRRTFLDPYGAEHPAEFFAVCTETFFEKGPVFKRKHPELHEVLCRYYRQDPAAQ
jgi:Mlc titration factor MtfA (ptsG expression regulator)